jgi:hypothetical protein
MRKSGNREDLMEIRRRGQELGRHAALALAIGVIALLGACKEAPVNAPQVTGPSELALSFLLTADPDVTLVGSTSAIGINIRDRNGAPIPGVRVFVESSGPGHLDRSFVVTNGNGIAGVTFFADAGGEAFVFAKPIGTDFDGSVFRRVSIAIAEPIS